MRALLLALALVLLGAPITAWAEPVSPAPSPTSTTAPHPSTQDSTGHVLVFTVLPLLGMGVVVASVALRHRRGPQGPPTP
jgi:hypothetical protein